MYAHASWPAICKNSKVYLFTRIEIYAWDIFFVYWHSCRANYSHNLRSDTVTLSCNAVLHNVIWAHTRQNIITEWQAIQHLCARVVLAYRKLGPPGLWFVSAGGFWTKCILFHLQFSQELWKNTHRIFQFCGWTLHNEGLHFLADSPQRFQWPSCVSQWHGTVAWQACKGTSSPLTSYSWFLIFSGLHKHQLLDLAVSIIRQGWITRQADMRTRTQMHANEHTQPFTVESYFFPCFALFLFSTTRIIYHHGQFNNF